MCKSNLVIGLFVLILASCVSSEAGPHSRIYFVGTNQYIWSYSMLKKMDSLDIDKYHYVEISEGQAVELEDGNLITVNNGRLLVNGKVINENELNIYLGKDGSLHFGSYIRTFK